MAITKKTFAMAGAIALLMLFGSASGQAWEFAKVGEFLFADQAQPVACAGSSRVPAPWVSLAWIALMLGVVFQTLLAILGGVLGGQKYNEFFKGGVWGLVETAAILSVFTIAFAELQAFGNANIDTARAYSTLIRNDITFDFSLLVVSSTFFSFISRQTPPMRMPAVRAFGMGFQLAPMFRPIFDGLGMMVQLMAAAVAEWVGQETFLCFIKTNMLAVLLPIGIFLRVLGIRGGGNALIAMAVVLYFIYPYLLLQFGEMLTSYFEMEMTNLGSEPNIFGTCSSRAICCAPATPYPANFDEPFVKNGPGWQTSLNDRISSAAITEGDFILTMGTGAARGKPVCMYNTVLGRAYSGLMGMWTSLGIDKVWTIPAAAASGAVGIGALSYLSKLFNLSWVIGSLIPLMIVFMLYAVYEVVFFLFVVSLVIPILMIFVTITAAKEIAKLLGTEIDLSSLEKLI